MIKFPKLHIAQSVTNRILNVANDIETRSAAMTPPTPSTAPPVPDPGPIGAAVETALAEPTAPVSADPAMVEAAVVDNLV